MSHTAKQQMDAIMGNSERSLGAKALDTFKRKANSKSGNARWRLTFMDSPQAYGSKPDSTVAYDIEAWITHGGEREVIVNGRDLIVGVREIVLTPAQLAKQRQDHFSGK